MRITQIKSWLVEGIKYNWVLVKVYTDEGITGIGEATNWPGSPLVLEACKHAGEAILGEDPTRIDYLWTKLYRDFNWLGRAGPVMSAISAIDIALWDIAGKRAGCPVYQLLGGAYRKQIKLYANYWFLAKSGTPMDYGDQALKVRAQGFTACKMDPFAHVNYWYGENVSDNLSLSEDQKRVAISRLATVQSTVGQEFLIAVETHALLNGPTAMEMAQRIAAAGINCMWYEEPAGAEFPDEIAAIRQKISLPVCVGERLHSRFMVRPILEKHAVDILMPDITRCGGISELKKIATMCEAYNVSVAPHNPNGPISTIAAAHVMASVPNFFLQEFMFTDVPWRDSVLDKPLGVRNGFLELSDEPGLGFDLVEEELDKHPGITQRRAGFYI
ncbi:MAG TPA: mandelate racemase/muconate lactonizing enzyme family protein [Terriglobales bacterium]|nr:mandelate racemase/muconate lactonizing enzyme family protein [Terriglobales bacterium]